MPISADDSGYYIVEESVYGTTPATPAFLELPIVSESVQTNANTTQSNTISSSRQVVDSVLTGLDVSGSIELEVARHPAMDLLMESMLAEDWDVSGAPAWELPVTNTKKSFTILKRFWDGAAYVYQYYRGCVVNTMTLTCTAGSEVTASIGIVGKDADADRSTIEIVGSTYSSISDFNVLRAPVVGMVVDNVGNTLETELSGVCVTDVTLNMNNNVRGIQCLGTLGNSQTVLGTFECSFDMTVFFTDNNLLEEFLEQNILDATLTIGDASGVEFYRFTMTRGKLASQSVVIGGAGSDVVNQLSYQALVDTTLTPATCVTVDTKAYS